MHSKPKLYSACSNVFTTDIEAVPASAGWLPPPANPAWYLNLITGHHTSDTYQACNTTGFFSASPSTTAYGTCTRIDTLTGGRIPAKIGVYFSGSSAASSIQITVNPSGGAASYKCSGNIDQQTFCNPVAPGWYCLTGGGTQYGYAFIVNS
jgi:hypothetical protein